MNSTFSTKNARHGIRTQHFQLKNQFVKFQVTMIENSLNDYSDILNKMSALDFSDGDFNRLTANKISEMSAEGKQNLRFTASLTKELDNFRTDPPFNPFLSKSTPCFSRHMSTTSLNSITSSEDHDYTRVKPTITSDLRYKIARNEPVRSHYYKEHIERFGKPPFIMGARATKLSTNLFLIKKRDACVP